ncbi:MAG: DUF4105 domain-containing protein [Bacteroidales bacterium]|nr:DUF4105 domain-containing protein [Bacteroidales bacterium]HOL96991.1 DUF4105 domain-containing protein [Bacteroidales bacterium]HOM36292.1 DUF4105 domain-containing protein [Bacteroidales bacterium]HPD23784.1 DUF4105 domain-containing protein [Bacteroidales bacterium]HRS98676.1 DUF4105 domain-containing protein [Bacteroidales bacterium]
MNKFFLLFVLFSMGLNSVFALSSGARVSLITQLPGDELYAYFGHTAIRIKDDSLGIDKVYNYGTFDFNTPNFYTKFIRGDLDYCLSIDDFHYFVYFSEQTKRKIYEQLLDLTPQEKENIYHLLEEYYNSEKRYYRYDFLKNNCATKIKDVLELATNRRIDFEKSNFNGKTFRQLLKPYVEKDYWINFGINLGMGLVTDQKASPSDYMFLPDYLYLFFNASDLLLEENVIMDAFPNSSINIFSYLSPWLILLIIVLLTVFNKTRKFTYYLVCVVFGLTGIFLLALGLYSLHPAIGNNLNIIWTFPAFLGIILKNKYREYFKFSYAILIILISLNWFWFPQELSLTFIPWFIMIIIVMLINTDFKVLKIFSKS